MWLSDSPYPDRPRECEQCGSQLELVYSNEASASRYDFKEKYRCENDKGHTGYVKGENGCPREWHYTGVVSR